MKTSEKSDLSGWVLLTIAVVLLAVHVITNDQYGFHRDELQTLDDARHLAWGYVAYPPVTPFFGRLALTLFGTSLRGIRFFPAAAQSIVVCLAALMARELGGGRLAQLIAALGVLIAPVSLDAGALYQYVSFDFLWWVLLAYLTIRLRRSGDDRLWLPIGIVIGLGMMTKYTIVFLVAGMAVGILVTDARRYLRSRWLWLGAALSLLIFLPHSVWQAKQGFISLDFLRHIHARDIRIGRTTNFLPEQLFIGANVVTIPLWIAGLYFYFVHPDGKRFRTIGWMFLVPFLLFVVAKGRGYYLAPGYPMLIAAGACVEERWLDRLQGGVSRAFRATTFAAMAVGGVLMAIVTLPICPIHSYCFGQADNSDFREEIGWPELVSEVARIRDSLQPDERDRVGVLAGNYGEAGAINLFGDRYDLPEAISGTNSFWLRSYPKNEPQTLIVLGLSRRYADELFESCGVAGHSTNPYNIRNEESEDHPDILVCRHLRRPWPEFWKGFRRFG